jgi:hypothetical protein
MAATTEIGTFAGQLKHFADSVDIVDKSTFDQVRELLVQYVSQELKAEFFELVEKEPTRNVDPSARLRGFWANDDNKLHGSWPVLAGNGRYYNPVTQSFASRKPMWIVGANKEPLDKSSAGAYRELWCDTSDLPAYEASADVPISTLIIVPLYSNRHEFGAYYIESSRYFEPTEVGKLELLRLGDALRILYTLFEVRRDQSACTNRAIRDLRQQLNKTRFPKLAKPRFFVAFSHTADVGVRRLIGNVLNEFADQLEVTDWSKMKGQGNISAQITKEITESRFGLCYLSQPVEGAGQHGHRYEDNANVIFEAGMLHARTRLNADDDTGQPTGWIPVREEDSPPAPFDFAGDRILLVPRAGGRLNDLEFQEQLRGRIEALLNES